MTAMLYTADRKPYPWTTKINPLWWLQNDEAKPGDSFAYLYLRNFMMNFKRFVVGVGDRDHWVTSSGADPLLVLRSDRGELGWKFSVIWIGKPHWRGVPALPFVSYSGSVVEWYLGWQPWGELCAKFTLTKSPFQVW